MTGHGSEPAVFRFLDELVGHLKRVRSTIKRRRRPDSNRGWRICNPLPQNPKSLSDKALESSAGAAGAKPGAVDRNGGTLDADLQAVADAWPGLSEATRRRVLVLIDESTGPAKRGKSRSVTQ